MAGQRSHRLRQRGGAPGLQGRVLMPHATGRNHAPALAGGNTDAEVQDVQQHKQQPLPPGEPKKGGKGGVYDGLGRIG
jgi:hypothetical protein